MEITLQITDRVLIVMYSASLKVPVLPACSALARPFCAGCPRGHYFWLRPLHKMRWCRFKRATRVRAFGRADALCPRGIWVGSRTLSAKAKSTTPCRSYKPSPFSDFVTRVITHRFSANLLTVASVAHTVLNHPTWMPYCCF